MRITGRLGNVMGLAAALGLTAGATALAQDRPPLGPKDGVGLAPTDTGRVAVGAEAPDFTLESLGGPRVTLSQLRGSKHVILVFYRGHW
jgi:hypothetical protein